MHDIITDKPINQTNPYQTGPLPILSQTQYLWVCFQPNEAHWFLGLQSTDLSISLFFDVPDERKSTGITFGFVLTETSRATVNIQDQQV